MEKKSVTLRRTRQEKATDDGVIDASLAGTTISVVLHRCDDNKLFTAYCGDSRCVMGVKNLVTGSLSGQASKVTLAGAGWVECL